MNIQFGEKLLSLSPSLAAQIGLEEAILAQLVLELSHICPSKNLMGKDWFYLAPERWPELIPFWNMTKINQVFHNLEALKMVERHHNSNGQFLIRLIPENAFHPAASANHNHRVEQQVNPAAGRPSAVTNQQARNANPAARARNQAHAGLPTFMIEKSNEFAQTKGYRTPMDMGWKPDQKLLIPRLIGDNIPVEFAREQLADFKSHYIETGTVASDWNTRFIRWVKEQYSKQTRYAGGYNNTQSPKQEQRDGVRRALNDIHDTSW